MVAKKTGDIGSLSNDNIRKACIEDLTGPLKEDDAKVLVDIVRSGITHQYRITVSVFGEYRQADYAKAGRSIVRLAEYDFVDRLDEWTTNPATGRPIKMVRSIEKGVRTVVNALRADEIVKEVGLSHKGKIAAGALIEMKEMDNKLIVVKLGEASPYPGKWCLPGGLCKLDEKPIDGLVRRVKKTIGVDIVPKTKRAIYDDLSESAIFAFLPVRAVIYKCKIIDGTPRVVGVEEQYAMEEGQTLKIEQEIVDLDYRTPKEIVHDPNMVDSIVRCILKYYKRKIKF